MTLAHSLGRLAERLPHAAPRSVAATRPGWLARGRRLMQEVTALLRDRDPRGTPSVTSHQAVLMRAEREVAAWRARAEAAEAQGRNLETRLAEAELVALDLRSRLVCLHGKLAATSATQRYHTLAQALEGALEGAQDGAQDGTQDGAAPHPRSTAGRRTDTAA